MQKEFKPKSDRAREEVETAVKTLAQQVLADQDLIADDAINSINAIVAEIDRKLAEQINLIMHNPQFQALESAWRGLHYLVNNTETDEMLKIKVFNISKKELAKTLKKFKGTAWDQSPIFKKVYEKEYGQLGGEPYGCLVGDYYFDHSAPDVELLSGIAQIAAAAHAPVHFGGGSRHHANGFLGGAGQSARPHQDLPDAGICRLALAARVGRFAVHRSRHAALPGAHALRREDQSGRRIRIRGRHGGRRIRTSTPGATRPMPWR